MTLDGGLVDWPIDADNSPTMATYVGGRFVDIRYPSRTLLVGAIPTLALVYWFTHRNWYAVGGVAALLAAIVIVSHFLIRLWADDAGVHVMNYGFTQHLKWQDIGGFELETSGGYGGPLTKIEIRMNDNRIVVPLATRQGITRYGRRGYEEDDLEQIVGHLRRMQQKHLGLPPTPD